MGQHLKQTAGLSASEIIETVYAFRKARVLLTAYELDLFSALDGGARSSAEVAGKLNTNPRATDRLMNALCAMKLLTKKDGRFANTSSSSRYLVRGKKDYLAGIMHSASLWHTWSTLTESVRVGSAVLSRRGMDGGSGDWQSHFIAAMNARAIKQAPAVAKLIRFDKVQRVLDVGGGSGIFSMAFVRARKGLKAVVFDLPSVIPLTKNYVRAEHLENSVETLAGDYVVDSFGSGYDLVFLSAIIHSNSPDVNSMLCRKAYDALAPKGRLAIMDHIMQEDRTAPPGGALFALNMLVGTQQGDTYTESEVSTWMKEAGFVQIRRTNTPFGTDLLIGRKPA